MYTKLDYMAYWHAGFMFIRFDYYRNAIIKDPKCVFAVLFAQSKSASSYPNWRTFADETLYLWLNLCVAVIYRLYFIIRYSGIYFIVWFFNDILYWKRFSSLICSLVFQSVNNVSKHMLRIQINEINRLRKRARETKKKKKRKKPRE